MTPIGGLFDGYYIVRTVQTALFASRYGEVCVMRHDRPDGCRVMQKTPDTLYRGFVVIDDVYSVSRNTLFYHIRKDMCRRRT